MPPPGSAGDVLQVGQRRVQALPQVLGQRHRPAALADLPGQLGDPVAQRPGCPSRPSSGCPARRSARRSGWRSRAGSRARPRRPGRSRRPAPAGPRRRCSARARSCRGLAAARRSAAARRRAGTPSRTAGSRPARRTPITATGSSSRGRGDHGRDNRCGAGHVAGHLVHLRGRLDRDAAGVEGDALADQRHRRLRVGGGVARSGPAAAAGSSRNRPRGCRRSRLRPAPSRPAPRRSARPSSAGGRRPVGELGRVAGRWARC